MRTRRTLASGGDGSLPCRAIMNTPPPPGTDLVELAIGALAILFLLGILVLILYLLYDAQRAIPPEYRHVEPAQVWLLLIPLFNFFVYPQIADSYPVRRLHSGAHRVDPADRVPHQNLWAQKSTAAARDDARHLSRTARGARRIPGDVRAAGAISTRAGCRAAAATAPAAGVTPVLPLWQPTQRPVRSLLPA